MSQSSVSTSGPPLATRLRLWAAGLSLLAGTIHGVAVEEHLSEWWGYGMFFITAAILQGVFGLVLFVQPWQGTPDPARTARQVYWVGVWGNVGIIALYLVTRTVGIPFFGPEAGAVEPITVISVVSKAVEVAIVILLILLLRGGRPKSAGEG